MIFSFFFVGWSRDPLSFAQNLAQILCTHTHELTKISMSFHSTCYHRRFSLLAQKTSTNFDSFVFPFLSSFFFFIPRFYFDIFLFFLSLFPPFTLHLSFLQTSRVTTRCSNQSSNLLPLPILHRERLATIFGKKIDFADKEILCIYISRCPNIYLLPIQL